ncbi:class I SAM-dependent methyltransferase [Chloroflexota bacterium]
MKPIELIKQTADKIHGFLSDVEGEFLYYSAKSCTGKGVIVEIGPFKGKSSVWLGKGSKSGRNVKIYAVDPFVETDEYKKSCGAASILEEFRKNIKDADIDDIVVPIAKTSEDAESGWSEPVELLWVDGAHECEMVKLDFELWFPHLIDDGIIAFHDTIVETGPRRVVKEFIFNSNYFKDVGCAGSITFARKVSRNSVKDRMRSKYVLFLQDIYVFSSRLKLPRLIKNMGTKIRKIAQGGNYLKGTR